MTSIVLGATGHVGSACAHALLERGETVIAVVRSAAKAHDLRERGAEIDIHDAAGLAAVLRRGERAFLLNPPADPAGDTDAEELRTVAAIARAAAAAGLAKLVAASTYGAQPGDAIGDLSVLHEFEQRLGATSAAVAIDRAAYYYSNWDASLTSARDEGVVRTPFPAEFELPMVAPVDLGRVAADRLLSHAQDTGIRYIEGPERYRVRDVAEVFTELLGRTVRIETVPRGDWIRMYRDLGFSEPAACAYARMTAVSLDGGFTLPTDPVRGEITLRGYLTELVARA